MAEPEAQCSGRPRCDGGEHGRCPRWAVWKFQITEETGPDCWTFACGTHLSWAATDLTGGEWGQLDLHRIAMDVR